MWAILYIAALLACGYTITALLADKRHPRRLVEMAGMSAALGCGVLPLALLILSMLGFTPTRVTVLGVAAAFIILLIALKLTHRLPRNARPVVPRMSFNEILITLPGGALIAVQLLFILAAATAVPVIEVDAWNIWGLKAKVLASEPLFPRPEYFTDLSLSYTHLDYPLLVPMIWAGAYSTMGAMDDAAGKAWQIVPLVGIVLLLYSALRDALPRGPAILLTALSIGSPAVSRWAGQGLADTTLAVFMLGTGVCLVRWIQNRRIADAIAAGLFTAFAIWTKLEGSILLVSTLLVVVIATIADRSRLRSAAAFLATAILLALPWWLWSIGLPHTHEDYASRLSPSSILSGLPRLTELAHLFWAQLRQWHWTIPAAIFVLSAAVNILALRRPEVLALWLILGVQIFAYLLAYLITPWKLTELVPITATRLMIQIAPLAMYLAGLHWREALTPSPPGRRVAVETEGRVRASSKSSGVGFTASPSP